MSTLISKQPAQSKPDASASRNPPPRPSTPPADVAPAAMASPLMNSPTMVGDSVSIPEVSPHPVRTAPVTADDERKLFVGNLARDTNDEELKAHFEQLVKVESVRILRNQSGRLNRYAFVVIEKREEQEICVEKLHGSELKGSKIIVEVVVDKSKLPPRSPRQPLRGANAYEMIANVEVPLRLRPAREPKPRARPQKDETPREQSDSSLFVSNIHFRVRSADLKAFFVKAGFEVTQAYVARDADHRTRGYGFVTLADKSLQQKAIAELHGQILNGRKINVNPAFRRIQTADSEKIDDVAASPEKQVESA